MRIAIVMLILLAAPAAAQPTAKQLARQYTEAGLAAQKAGEYETAISFYAKAYTQIPHPVLLFNMAQANRLAGRKQLALDLYRRYVDADPEGSHASIARSLIAEIERELAARAADEQRAQAQAREEAAQRASAERRKELARTEEAERELEEARRASAEARRARDGRDGRDRSAATLHSGAGSSSASAVAAVTGDLGERRRARRRLHAYAAGSAGLVTIGVGLYVGSRARATWDQAHASGDCDAQHRCNPGGLAAIDDAHGQARIATGATVLGVAALATGAALFWTAREPRSSATALRAAPMVSPTAAGLVLAGGF